MLTILSRFRGLRRLPPPRRELPHRGCILGEAPVAGPEVTHSGVTAMMSEWHSGAMPSALPEVDVTAVPAEIPADVTLLDVREDDEWQAGHIDGAVHIPLPQVPQRLAELETERRVLVVCKVGGRSAQATQFLCTHGRDAVNLAGGMIAWEAAGRPMVRDDGGDPFVA